MANLTAFYDAQHFNFIKLITNFCYGNRVPIC